MAQLLVHIDDDLKRELKTRLASEGRTLRSWVEEQAQDYLAAHEVTPVSPPSPTPHRPASAVVHPQTGLSAPPQDPEPTPKPVYEPLESDYNLEEASGSSLCALCRRLQYLRA